MGWIIGNDRRIVRALSFALGAWAFAAPASAFDLGYGGRIVTSSGSPADGAADLSFDFYGTETGGSALNGTPVKLDGVPLKDGVFAVNVTLADALAATIFADPSTPVWVQVTDRTRGHAYPRQRFLVVPYALKVPVDNSLTYDAQGRLGVAATAPVGGRAVSSAPPAGGDFLKWNAGNSQWEPGGVVGASGGTVTSLTLGTSLTGSSNPITTSGTIDLANGVDPLKLSPGTVSSTELGYLDGVTSALQTQLNGKAASAHSHAATEIAGGAVDNTEFGYLDGVTSALQTQLNGKAASAHTHAAAEIAGGAVDNTEFGYLDGVTSALQTQLNGKAASAHTHAATEVGGGTVDNTELGYLDGVTSALQTQLNGKAASTHSHAATDIAGGTVDNTELGYLDGVTSSVQTQLNGKAATSHAHSSLDASDGNPTGALSVDAAGWVGVGTASPGSPLEVFGATAEIAVRNSATARKLVLNSGFNSASIATSGAGIPLHLNDFGGNALTLGNAFGGSSYPISIDTSTGRGAQIMLENYNTAGGSALVVKGTAAAQTADLLQWRDNTDALLGLIDSAGRVAVGNTSPGAQLQVESTATGRVALAARAASGQTANIQEWQANGGAALAAVDKNGYVSAPNVASASRIQDFRLSLSVAGPFTTTDVTAATSVYLHPFTGTQISLYDTTAAAWKIYTLGSVPTVAVPATTNTNFDVFLYDNAGTPTLEAVSWTNDTTRATALAQQDGVFVKSGALGRRYLGTGRTTGVSGQAEDSLLKRFLWNQYHRRPRPMVRQEPTSSWSYTSSTYRMANNSAANRIELVMGSPQQDAFLEVKVMAHGQNGTCGAFVGIGVNSTTANSSMIDVGLAGNGAPAISHRNEYPRVGYSYYQWLEQTDCGTVNYYGLNGGRYDAGIYGVLE